MAEAKDIDFGNGVQLTDWGEAISFDGVYLQFGVSIDRDGDWGVAYFGEKEDAEIFARAKAVQLGTQHGWIPISSFEGPDRHEVDLWMNIDASPRSMGWADAFRVIDAYRKDGKWFHLHEGKEKELFGDYITHWREKPMPPKSV